MFRIHLFLKKKIKTVNLQVYYKYKLKINATVKTKMSVYNANL